MLWKVAARVYLDKRREFAEMDDATFEEYRRRWAEKAEAARRSEVDPRQLAKWAGFNDALWDETSDRESISDGGRDGEATSWLDGLLDYLYDKE